MLKMSKSHIAKTAQMEEVPKEIEISGADVVGDDELEDVQPADMGVKTNKPDARQEAATPHAIEAKELFSKRRELLGQLNAIDQQLDQRREVLRALDPKMRHEAYLDDKELRDYLKPEKVEEKKRKRKKLDKQSVAQVVEGLLKVADLLDNNGDEEGVMIVEDVIRNFAAKESDVPQYNVENVEKTKREYPEIEPYAPSLSTMGCPDHHGIKLARIGEGSYQCQLDGKVYNWNQGFKDYAGNVYEPAPIRSVDFPDLQQGLFETRPMALSKRQK